MNCSSAPRYSLVIATLDDQGDLAANLKSLVSLRNAPPFEVIIVDQNSDDRLQSLVATFADRLRIAHLRVDFQNASRARNLGARMALGEWLGFPDDDCQLLPDALTEADRMAADPAVSVITGRTVDANGQSNLVRWRKKPVEFGRWRMFSGCLAEATMFVRKELFVATGGFDEDFGPGARFPAAEGIDLMSRMFDVIGAGKARYTPRIAMQHPTKIPPWTDWAVNRHHQYAIGFGAFISKRPRLPIIYWGTRSLVWACLRTLVFRGRRRRAYAAHVTGLLRGVVAYRLYLSKR